eukprot:g59728.t1
MYKLRRWKKTGLHVRRKLFTAPWKSVTAILKYALPFPVLDRSFQAVQAHIAVQARDRRIILSGSTSCQ